MVAAEHLRIFYISMALGIAIAAVSNIIFGPGDGFILLDDLECTGTESNLLECRSTTEHGVNNCNPNEDAGVFCASEFLNLVLQCKYNACLFANQICTFQSYSI